MDTYGVLVPMSNTCHDRECGPVAGKRTHPSVSNQLPYFAGGGNFSEWQSSLMRVDDGKAELPSTSKCIQSDPTSVQAIMWIYTGYSVHSVTNSACRLHLELVKCLSLLHEVFRRTSSAILSLLGQLYIPRGFKLEKVASRCLGYRLFASYYYVRGSTYEVRAALV